MLRRQSGTEKHADQRKASHDSLFDHIHVGSRDAAANIAPNSANLPDRSFDVWHDRAVFHFLSAPEERIYELITGNRAFEGKSPASVMAVMRDQPAASRRLSSA